MSKAEIDEFIDYWGKLDSGDEETDRKLMRADINRLIAEAEERAFAAGAFQYSKGWVDTKGNSLVDLKGRINPSKEKI